VCSVGAVDEIHRNPESTVILTVVIDPHDVRVPQLASQIGVQANAR